MPFFRAGVMASSTRPVAGTTWLAGHWGPSTFPRYQREGGLFRSPHRLAATCQPTANGSRSGGVAWLRQSRSALRRSLLGHGHGQAIGAGIDDSGPWKNEETIVGWPRLLVAVSFFSPVSKDKQTRRIFLVNLLVFYGSEYA